MNLFFLERRQLPKGPISSSTLHNPTLVGANPKDAGATRVA